MKPIYTLLFTCICTLGYGQVARKDSAQISGVFVLVNSNERHNHAYSASMNETIQAAATQNDPRNKAKVYVNRNPKEKMYHSEKNCRGLDQHSSRILTVTKAEAEKKYYKIPCSWCY
jgi:hypothetical protein